MQIFIFSDSVKTAEMFSSITRSKGNTVTVESLTSLKKMIKEMKRESMVYVDAGKMAEPEIKKQLSMLSKQEGIYFGIIDPKGTVEDVAGLFHQGASDYIGKKQMGKKLPAKRIDSIIEYLKKIHGDDAVSTDDAPFIENFISSGSDWKDIRPGKEYSFCFMFIELDNQKYIKGKYGDINTGEFVAEFRQLVSEKFAPINGKVWMWLDFGGLILFPFDGEKCIPILECFKFFMDLKIITAEEFSYDDQLSIRIALHTGNTEYKERGDTGEIISDSVNSIYHLGQRFAEPGTLVITETLFRFIPRELKDYFVDAGIFEGRHIRRMKRLL